MSAQLYATDLTEAGRNFRSRYPAHHPFTYPYEKKQTLTGRDVILMQS